MAEPCDSLLKQKKSLSKQLEDIDEELPFKWSAALAADTLPGGPADSDSVNDVQIRMGELAMYIYGPEPNRTTAINAAIKYNDYLSLKSQRAMVQAQLNAVILQLLQNNCPLE